MKTFSFFVAFFSTLSMAQASSYYAYQMNCEAALAGDVSKGQPAIRTTLKMTFCGVDISGMSPFPDENGSQFWSEESYLSCLDQKEPGVLYQAERHDGTQYSGFIPAAEAIPLTDGEDGREWVMGSCDGDICEGDSAYFRLSTVAEEQYSSIQLVRQGRSGALRYDFEKAKCFMTDAMANNVPPLQ